MNVPKAPTGMSQLCSLNIVAIIPARGGSKGIPQKNLIMFAGKPLLTWSIEQALSVEYINGVYITTDDDNIASLSKEVGAEVIKRPEELATDTATSEAALLHALQQIEKQSRKPIDIVVFLQATSPLRTSQDIQDAINTFVEKDADSLFSASILKDFLIWHKKNDLLRSLSYSYENRGRRQDRKPVFLENGSIYVFKPQILKEYNNRLGGRIEMFYMPFWKSFEIDSIEDIPICEFLMKTKIIE